MRADRGPGRARRGPLTAPITRTAVSRGLVAALALGALLAAPSIASAQSPSTATADAAASGDDATARALFEEGRQAWDAGDYPRAADRWERAFNLSGRPELLYNLGNARFALHQLDAAESAYGRFLSLANPEPARRREVEGRLDEIRVQRAATGTPTSDGASGASGGEDIGSRFLGTWISAGATVALAGTGAGLLAAGESDAGNALLGIAALGAVTTVVVLFVEGDFAASTPASGPAATGGTRTSAPPALVRF